MAYGQEYSTFRSTAVTNAATAITTGTCVVFGYNIVNRHTADIFVKLYDVAAASVVVGTTTPKETIQVVANQSVVLRDGDRGVRFLTASSVAVTTESADTGTTAPATLPIIHIFYD